MSTTVFSARFTPTGSTPVNATDFNVIANLFDGTGEFGGADVQVNDIVYLDTFNSITAPNSISKFKVVSITSFTSNTIHAKLRYDDTGPVVDPSEVIGNPGYICRSSPTDGLAFHAAPTIHTFYDYITQIARNKENLAKLDGHLAAGGGSGSTKVMVNNSGVTIPALSAVSKRGDGGIMRADSDATGAKVYIGFAMSAIANSASGTIQLVGPNFAGVVTGLGFSPGDTVYISESAGLTNDPNSFTNSDDVFQRVGIADCAAGVATAVAVDLISSPDLLAVP